MKHPENYLLAEEWTEIRFKLMSYKKTHTCIFSPGQCFFVLDLEMENYHLSKCPWVFRKRERKGDFRKILISRDFLTLTEHWVITMTMLRR